MQGMRRLILLVCGFALFSASAVSAQETFLPKQFQSWTLTSCVAKPVVSAIWKEVGLREFSACQFHDGDKVIGISGGRYHDPSSAFEIYTSRLRPGMMPTNLGQLSAFDKDGVLILEGSLVLDSTANVSKEDLSALVMAVDAKSEKAPLPPIRTYLPATGRLLGSERYALGPEAFRAALDTLGESEMGGLVRAAGFSDNVEAMMARYSGRGNGSGVLLLLEYPTPNLAEQYIHHLDEVLTPELKAKGTTIERKGSVLSMVLSPSSPEFAKSLRESVDYETKVTWNEASQTATDPPITSTLVKIIMGTGVFMMAAIALGVAFGGVRVITKRFFPGKVFDRPEQMEVLQLGLSGKRIDPTDFY
jgi:hypothetical protein